MPSKQEETAIKLMRDAATPGNTLIWYFSSPLMRLAWINTYNNKLATTLNFKWDAERWMYMFSNGSTLQLLVKGESNG